MRIDRRLTRLEAAGDDPVVLGWIRQERFYDELTNDEKARYCCYYCGSNDYRAVEEVLIAVGQGLHFQLERKLKPPSPSEHRAIVAEIEAEVDDFKRRYAEEGNR